MRASPLPVLLAMAFASLPARADDPSACFDAAETGQKLRAAHKLIEAREKLRLCLAPTCPATMRTDCSTWFNEIESAIPTVVLSAKDATGNDVLEVVVTVDDRPLVNRLDGAAIPMDPGPHTFRFQWPDGTSRERRSLVVEGQKDLVIAVSLAPTGSVTGGALPPPSALPVRGEPATTGPWRTLGLVTGAAGLVGLTLGAVFTGVTIADKNAAGCDAAQKCTNYPSIGSARDAAPVAGSGLIGGGALVAAGALLLWLPRAPKERPSSGTLRVSPLLERQGAGARIEGSW
jgi:hypothetical protein